MNYNEAMKYINNTAKFGSKYGLERTEKVLELLGNPHKKLKCIHIAGTNGKGSTTAMINEILKEAGYKVGMYISPYLEEFEERIQINGVNIPKNHLAETVTEVSSAIDKVISLGYEHPTEFEIITCTMFKYFYDQEVDYAVVEVGLGGRLDSTNVITPMLSIITSISYDHMKILGDTLDKIAYEKAGIIKEGIPLVLYPQEKESLEIIEKVCQQRSSRLIEVFKECAELKQVDSYKQNLEIRTKRETYDIKLSLLGKHQILNCAVAVNAAEELINMGLNIKKDHILSAMEKVKWPGRLEIMKENPLVVIDGAHNIDGIKKLAESIDIYLPHKKMVLILGILADKQVEDMVNIIAQKADRIIAVTPHSERAELADELLNVIKKVNTHAEAVDDYEEAYKIAKSYCGKNDLLLISGSLYMIGDIDRKSVV